jgi:hypothetical protein
MAILLTPFGGFLPSVDSGWAKVYAEPVIKERLIVYVDPAEGKRLRELSRERGVPVGNMVRRAIGRGCKTTRLTVQRTSPDRSVQSDRTVLQPLLGFCLIHPLALVLDKLLAKTFLGLGRYFEEFQRDFEGPLTLCADANGWCDAQPFRHSKTGFRHGLYFLATTLLTLSLDLCAQRLSYFVQAG